MATPILDSWEELNLALMKMTEQQCVVLLKRERESENPRKGFLFRIHSRLNKLRADRERKELKDVLVYRAAIRRENAKKLRVDAKKRVG